MVIKANSNRISLISGLPDEVFCYTYSVQSLEEKDYGNYTLTLNSSRGSKSFKFQVIRPIAPSPPINVSVDCDVSTAHLSWIAGSAGGAPTKALSFFLLYHKEGTIPSLTVKRFSCPINQGIENEQNKGIFLKNGTELAPYTFNFHNLDKGKHYVFELYSANAIRHCSEPSQSVKCKTSKFNNSSVMIDFIIIITDYSKLRFS